MCINILKVLFLGILMIKYVDIKKKDSNGNDLVTISVTPNDIKNINKIGNSVKNLISVSSSSSSSQSNNSGVLFQGSNVLTAPVSAEHPDETVVITRDVGELVFSVTPLINAGLHLADGALLDANGIYKEGIEEIVEKYSNTANYFCTEEEWQTSVSTYGKCAKFVYDSTNQTLRLPKLEGYLETTTDSTKSGDHTEAGLPNVTGTMVQGIPNNQATGSGSACLTDNLSGAFSALSSSPRVYYTGTGTTAKAKNWGLTLDASRSSPIYGKSNTVQTDSLKVLVYVVLATAKKIPAEVNVDNLVNDLSTKANNNFDNITNEANVLMAHNAMPSTRYVQLSVPSSGSFYTAPADGWFLLDCGITGQFAGLIGSSNIRIIQNTAGGAIDSTPFLPVRKGEQIQVAYDGSTNVQSYHLGFRFIYANGSASE